MATIRAFLKDESGATAIEYGLIASGLVLLIVGSIRSVSTQTNDTFSGVAAGLAAGNGTAP